MTDASTTSKSTVRKPKRRQQERLMAVAAIILIALFWFLGSLRAKTDLMPAVREAMPEAKHFDDQGNDLYTGWNGDELLGYVAIGTADGYGGPVELAVAVNLDGEITGLSVVRHKETQSWFTRVINDNFLQKLTGKSYTDDFELGQDVDTVTGATYTSRALAEAALEGSHEAAKALGMEVEASPSPKIQFGVPEIAILALFAVGYVGHRRGFRYKKQVRWGSMIAGLIILGFLYNLPFTLAYFVKLILGYWPQWQTNLYWYFLLGGILFVVTADNKNPYCEWFCPFGAAQECLGFIGGARVYSVRRYRFWLVWTQRLLALSAVLLGVFYRSPGLASFEIFGTLFSFVGSSVQFALLAIVLIVALFVRRPWCTFLCPLHSVVEFIRIIRQWIKELWQNLIPNARTVSPKS